MKLRNTLSNAMDKFRHMDNAIAVALRACHRIKDSGQSLSFIKDRHTLPFFTARCLCYGITVAGSAAQLWAGNSKALFGKHCKIIDKCPML